MDKRQHTLAVLVRWREFQHALARDAHQARIAATRDADLAVQEADCVARTLQAHKSAVVAAPELDLVRLTFVDALEEQAWEHHAGAVEAHTSAAQAQLHSQQAHLHARSHLNVAESGHARVRHENQQAQEMREFDQLTALLAAGAVQ